MRLKLRIKFLKKIFPKTLFGRSLLILVIPIVSIQAVSTYLFFDRHWSKVTSRLSYAVAGEVSWIVDEFNRNQGNLSARNQLIADAQKKLDINVNFTSGVHINLVHNKNEWDGWESLIGNSLENEISKHLSHPYTIDVDFQEKWVEINVELKDGVLTASIPQRRLYSSSSYIFLLWVFFVSFFLLLIAVLFMRNQIRPIRRLGIVAEKFGKGQDVSDYKIEGAKEVRQAGQAFIDMKTRIQRQISQRTEMLAGVSHDLRTPLTRMKLQLEMLPHTADIEALQADVRDMETMIDGYLNFVRGEGGEQPVEMNLNKFIENVIQDAKRYGCNIIFQPCETDINVHVRPMAFKRCINNILSNANKYANQIWLSLSLKNEGKVEILIEDNGCGIPEGQYEDVFRPFFRGDSSRNMSNVGVGLGLPIAKDIINSHGGKIWLEKSTHGGLAVYIKIPI